MSTMIHFRKVFENLESLGHLGINDNTDPCALCSAHILVISKIIVEFKECCGHHHLPVIGHKSSRINYLTISLNNQVINSNLDPETMRHLSEWENVPLLSGRELIFNHPFHIELNNYQTTHAQHLKNQLLESESKHVLVRNYLQCLLIH